MNVKLMRTAIPLVLMAGLVMTAGAALTSLPDSSHYSGTSYYQVSPSNGKVQTGRVEFAVYDTQTYQNEFVGTDGFTKPGTGRYVYAYQIFNYNEYGAASTSVPYFVIQSLGANAVTSNNNIGTRNDATGGVNATSYSLSTNTSTSGTPAVTTTTTSVVFAFDNGILAAGENSWYLVMSSDQDWVKGTYSMETPKNGDIPQPEGTASQTPSQSNTPVAPEPASLLLMGLGAVTLLKRKKC
jgi:hypothetical protein